MLFGRTPNPRLSSQTYSNVPSARPACEPAFRGNSLVRARSIRFAAQDVKTVEQENHKAMIAMNPRIQVHRVPCCAHRCGRSWRGRSPRLASRRRQPASAQRLRRRLPQPLQRLPAGKRSDPQVHARRRLQAVEGLHLRSRRPPAKFPRPRSPVAPPATPLIFSRNRLKAASPTRRAAFLFWQGPPARINQT